MLLNVLVLVILGPSGLSFLELCDDSIASAVLEDVLLIYLGSVSL